MADPLSIAASVGGLALLARDIVKQVASVISTVRGATSQLQALRHSVALLYGYLESLDSMLDDEDDSPAPLSILACNTTLDKIQGILKNCRAEQELPASSSTPTPSISSAKPGVWKGVKQKVRWVLDKDEVEKLLADLEKHKSVLSLALSKNCLSSIIEVFKKQDETLQHMQEIKKKQSQIRQQQIQDNERRLGKERRKMLSTFSQMRPEDSFKKHLSLHQDGTGVWFLESLEFENFMSTPNSKLWIYGIPGAGKSVLSATIIDHISTQRTEHVALASFFCEYFNTATQICRNIFGSIAKQLALQNPNALETLEEFFNDQTDLGQLDFNPEDDELLELIVQMSTNFDNTIIVIDGLDECQENRSAVVESLAQLSRGTVGSIKALYASRKESDIQECLSSFDSLPIAASKADVRLYVAAQLKSRFRKMCEKDPALSEQILTVLVDKSEGMFQWVRCQIDCLENLASNKQRRKALEDLPRDLHGTYERILLRAIKSSEHATIEFVERTLRWIALAMTPLSVAEIAHAISVEVDERSFDDSLDMRIILALCSSLVREVDGSLVFSHFSVKEYLMQINPEEGLVARFRVRDSDHSILAQTCLTYLLLDDFDRQGCVAPANLRPVDDERPLLKRMRDPYLYYPFYGYAAFRWVDHAEAYDINDAVSTLKQDLFDPKKTDHFVFWAHSWTQRSHLQDTSQKMYDIAPLHLACIYCFTDLVDVLLRNGSNANGISAVLGSPLQCAISGFIFIRGEWKPDDEARHQTVRRLLSEQISRDQSRYDPVADALERSDEKVARTLLEHGFALTVSAVDNWWPQAVSDSLLKDHMKSSDLEVEIALKKKFVGQGLLDSLFDQKEKRKNRPIPLHLEKSYKETIIASCRYGRLQDVKGLLSRQESLTGDQLSNLLSECLIVASTQGHAGVVQYLMEAGADPAFQGRSDGRTALHMASKQCHADVVRTLLELSKTTISGIKDDEGLTPWMCAIQAGSIETLEDFLADPSTINLQTTTNNGQTAAHLAARTCNEQMISYLKERGIDFTCLDASGKSPIHALLEPYCGSAYNSFGMLKALRRMFRYLQRTDMLTDRLQSGQTLVHLIADLHPYTGTLLWEDIRDNQIFNDTRSWSLTIEDSDGNTPLHLAIQNLGLKLKEDKADSYLVDYYIEFVQLLLTSSDEVTELIQLRNKSGRTPVMEFAWYVADTTVAHIKKQFFSDQILRTFRILGDVGNGRLWLEKVDNANCTILHYIAGCKTNFPFNEITEYLLEGSVNVTAKDSGGDFALSRAGRSSEENIDFMQLLIPYMSLSQFEEKDSNGRTILHWICANKKAGIQDLVNNYLLQEVARCEKQSPSGRIPLHFAPGIITEHAIASRLVQAATANTIDICDNEGKNCMYWSCELGSIAMVSALLDAGANIDAPLGPESETGAVRDPPLLIAAYSNQIDMVRFLLDRGADPLVKGRCCWQLHHHAFNPERNGLLAILENLAGFDYDAKADFYTYLGSGEDKVRVRFQDAIPLHFAADSGDEKGLQWLFDQDKLTDLNVETQDGSTPLILATLHGYYNVCKRLLELGSLIPKARHDGCTALHAACQYGHLKICKLLIAMDNDCVFQKFGDQTPLEIAVGNGHKDIVELLLMYEAQVTVEVEIKARKASHHDIAELLRRKLSTGNGTSAGNTTVELDAMRLKAACDAQSESTLMEVLQKGINPNIRLPDDHGTPLHFACKKGWQDVVKLLVERNTDMEALDDKGRTPLLRAVKSNQLECTKLLCRKGAQITAKDQLGNTALHEAAWNDNSASVTHFLMEGLEVNAKAYDRKTPLHLVSDPACVDLLLEQGADPFVVGSDNETVAWNVCSYPGGKKMLEQIFSNQPAEKVQQSIETINSSENSTLLYRTAFQGSSDVVSTLIEYGAKVNGHCGPLGAPLHAALRQGHVEIATTLLENGARPYRVIRDGEENAGWFWEYGYEFCLQGQNGVWVSRSL